MVDATRRRLVLVDVLGNEGGRIGWSVDAVSSFVRQQQYRHAKLMCEDWLPIGAFLLRARVVAMLHSSSITISNRW